MIVPTTKLALEIATFVAQHKKIFKMLVARDKDVDTMGTKLVCNYLNTDHTIGVLTYEVIFEYTTQPDKEQNDDIKVLVHVMPDAQMEIVSVQTY